MVTVETTTKTVTMELGEVYATFEEAYADMTGAYKEGVDDEQMLVLPNTSDFHPEMPWGVWTVKSVS